MVPGLSIQRALLYRSNLLHIAVNRFEVFPDSFQFTIRCGGRGFGNGRFFGIFDPGAGWPIEDQIDPDSYDQPEDLCRVGIEFSGGTRSEYLLGDERDGPEMQRRGGSGWNGGCTTRVWVKALPPPGDFSIFVVWPTAGVEESVATFDADELRGRAAAAQFLLPE